MTREEAIANINMLRNEYNDQYIDYCGVNEAVNMAIEALQAEPIKHGRWEHYKTETLGDDIMGGEYRFKFFRCSECRFDVGGNSGFHYCPNCGARMDEQTDYHIENDGTYRGGE